MPLELRDRLDALDRAYRKLKDRGGQFREAWQDARFDINAEPKTPAGRELAALAREYEQEILARKERATEAEESL